MLLGIYKGITAVSAPLIEGYLKKREAAGKEDPARRHERRGNPQMPRGEGRIIWIHAASVGESMSMLALISRLLDLVPDARVLMTTGTVASAKMMADRLPPRAFHQYVPVDQPKWVAGFIDYWKPSIALFAESEFWPNILAALKSRGIPSLLISSRVTEKSARRWKKFARGMIKSILAHFDLCLAQGAVQADRLRELGAEKVEVSSALKYAAAPLPCDAAKLEEMKNQVAGRKVVIWSSTHKGADENTALITHQALKQEFPDLLSIVVPRHVNRAGEIVMLFQEAGFTTTLRSAGDKIGTSDIYIADTLGELGLFYRLCKNVVMCGSFTPMGGHNVIESAQLGCINITGPHVFNFQTVIDDFEAQKAILQVKAPEEVAPLLANILRNPDKYAPIGEAAKRLTEGRADIVDDVAQKIIPHIKGAV